MQSKEFFETMTDRSKVKVEVVRKYFWAWAKIISKQVLKRGGNKIGYVDLFAGKGRYDDGTPSIPILILEAAIREPTFSRLLEAKFNDEDKENAQVLSEEINKLSGINTLNYPPAVHNFTVDDDLADRFSNWRTPTLFFLDPFGYKGLSLRLIEALLRPWGCDCIFFFNYNRINMSLSNPVFESNMNAFFGKTIADHLRENLKAKSSPVQRQELIITELKEALQRLGGRFTLEYYFKDEGGKKTSHFLIFASKNVLGYNIMKSIMGKESTGAEQGVPSFGFNPLDKEEKLPSLFDLFEMGPIDELAASLLNDFAGRILSMEEVYREHNVGKPYLRENYKEALRKLESTGKITAEPPAEKRTRQGNVTFGESVVVTFPTKEE